MRCGEWYWIVQKRVKPPNVVCRNSHLPNVNWKIPTTTTTTKKYTQLQFPNEQYSTVVVHVIDATDKRTGYTPAFIVLYINAMEKGSNKKKLHTNDIPKREKKETR